MRKNSKYECEIKNGVPNGEVGGHSDWRLPNIKVLRDLFKKMHSLGTNYSDAYWSSTTASGQNKTNKWFVHFGTGNTGVSEFNYHYYFRCVRRAIERKRL